MSGMTGRRAVLILFCLALLALTMPVGAQAPWSVYLLDTGTQALLRVGADGSQTTIPLGLGPGDYLSAYDISFSPDGTKAALCPVNYGDEATPPKATLIILDLTTQTQTLRTDLGPALGCRATYRSDGSFIALGLVHYLPGDVQAVPDLPAWELRVVEPALGGTIAQLRADGPEAAAAGLASNPPVLPVVRRFDGAELVFAAMPFATGGPGVVPAFSWRVDAAALTPAEPWGNLQIDAIPGADIAWAAADPTRPAGQPPGPLPANNVALVRDSSGQIRPVFASPDWLLIGTRFIDDGRRLALQLVAPMDPAATDARVPTRWIAVDRSGAVEELTGTASYAQLAGAPGGYVVLQAFTPDGGLPTYTLDYNAGGQIQTLWAAESSASAFDLAWAPPVTAGAGLPPFAAIP